MSRTSRRGFVRGAGAGSALGLFASHLATPEFIQAQEAAQENVDQKMVDFWTTEFNRPLRNFRGELETKGGTAYEPEFVFYDPATSTFRARSEVPEASLIEKGPVRVSLNVQRIRLSPQSQGRFENSQTGTLRIDLKQSAPLPGLLEILAWTSIAAIFPDKQNKLPPLPDLKFDPASSWDPTKEVPLTNGLAFWGMNFTLKPKATLWAQLVNAFRIAYKVTNPVFSVMGLPAIGSKALAEVDHLFGALQGKGEYEWLFQCQGIPFFATREWKTKFPQGVPLLSGDYVVLPHLADRLENFDKERSGLTLIDGYLVKKGTSPFGVLAAAPAAIKDTDYITLHVTVEKGIAADQKKPA